MDKTYTHYSKRKSEIIICFVWSVLSLVTLFFVLGTGKAYAVPGYARQTGLSCTACHSVFPELTSFGRQFKLNGYTLTSINTVNAMDDKKKEKLKILTISAVSAMVQSSYTRINKNIPETQNNNVDFPQQLSLFYAGEVTPHMGAFIQLTYDGQDGSIGMDNIDLRYYHQAQIGSKELLCGLTLNNNPTVQDIWNTTPAWGYPYASSEEEPSPIAATLIEDALGQQVAGLGAFALFQNTVYGEISLYRSVQQGVAQPPGADASMYMKGVTPYWRVALQHQWTNQFLELGTFGLTSKLYPEGISGLTDQYTDIGLDLQYEYTGAGTILSLHTSWISEKQSLDATYDMGGSASENYNLKSYKADGSIYLHNSYGLTVGYFSVSGNTNTGMFGPSPVDGSRLQKPNTNGFIGQISFLPWYNTKFAVQYTMFTKFNGAGDNYDGSGRDAASNNTLYLLTWINF